MHALNKRLKFKQYNIIQKYFKFWSSIRNLKVVSAVEVFPVQL